MKQLVDFGAVYYCPVHPKVKRGLAGEKRTSVADAMHAAGVAQHGRSVRHPWNLGCFASCGNAEHLSP